MKTSPKTSPPAGEARTALLMIERGPGTGARIQIKRFPARLGRDPENDICIPDSEISRFHLRIKQRGKLFIIEDLDSRNGTWLNGDKILNSTIKNGDKIFLGGTELLFLTTRGDIQLAADIVDFDMVVAEELGLAGPLALQSASTSDRFAPLRLEDHRSHTEFKGDAKVARKIFDQLGDIQVFSDLEQAAGSLLKYAGALTSGISRAAFLMWNAPTRQLVPVTTRRYTIEQEPKKFILSQRAMEDVLTRRKGIILHPDSAQVTQPGLNRAILPMIHHEMVVGLLHLESDDKTSPLRPEALLLLQTLMSRAAPMFEVLVLRRELDSALAGMIETMVATVEAKDTYTRGHSERVSRYCMAIADELKLNRETKRLLLISALCHDIGKIGVPDSILKKAALLSVDEYEEMKLHPTIGAEIVSHMPNAHRFISGVKHHHEKWDGSGYPDGLAGEEIPFFGRIVAVADIFDALVSGRSYSGFIAEQDAVQRLSEDHHIFDPEILKAFLRAFENGRLVFRTSTQNNEPTPQNEENPASVPPTAEPTPHSKK